MSERSWFSTAGARALGLAVVCASLMTIGTLAAKEAAPAVADPVLEAKVLRISAELRCLVCQNQTIADSHADLAIDLRRQVREMLQRGESEAQIIDYMTARYGDFVLYRPPLKPTTAALWFGPPLLLVGGLVMLGVILWRRSKLAADRFDPDEPDAADPNEPQAPR